MQIVEVENFMLRVVYSNMLMAGIRAWFNFKANDAGAGGLSDWLIFDIEHPVVVKNVLSLSCLFILHGFSDWNTFIVTLFDLTSDWVTNDNCGGKPVNIQSELKLIINCFDEILVLILIEVSLAGIDLIMLIFHSILE